MTLSWLANTSQGRMVGDYISTSVPAGANAWPTITVANTPTGGTFRRGHVRPTGGLAISGGTAGPPVAVSWSPDRPQPPSGHRP